MMNENMNMNNENKGGFNRKLYLTILWIFTIACILVGSWIHVVVPGTHFLRNLPGIHFSDGHISVGHRGGAIIDDTISINEAVNAMYIYCSLADLEIRVGNAYEVQIHSVDELCPTVDTAGGVLNIIQDSDATVLGSSESCSITITVPGSVSLNDITIACDLGDVDIRDISCGQLDVTADLGAIELYHVSAENFYAVADCGDITARDMQFTFGDLTCDLGSIELDGAFDRVDAYCDMGSIDISGSFNEADVECDLGDAEVVSSNPNAVIIIDGQRQ